jgi:hypothetical protein
VLHQFVPGQPYFLVTFFDDTFLVPKVESLVYLGTETDVEGDAGRANWLCFQDASSYVNCGRFDTIDQSDRDGDEIEVKSFRFEDAHLVDDLAGVIAKLEECLRRSKGSRGQTE